MDIRAKIEATKKAIAKKDVIALDDTVISDRYFSPAEKYIVPTADKYVLSKYREYDHEQRDELIKAIAVRIAGGQSKKKACELPFKGAYMDYTTLKFWIRQVPEYRQWIEEAEEDRYENIFEDILNIGDELGEDGDAYYSNKEKIAIAKLRTAARMHFTAKGMPDRFGNRSTNQTNVAVAITWEEKKTYHDDSLKLDNVIDISHKEEPAQEEEEENEF